MERVRLPQVGSSLEGASLLQVGSLLEGASLLQVGNLPEGVQFGGAPPAVAVPPGAYAALPAGGMSPTLASGPPGAVLSPAHVSPAGTPPLGDNADARSGTMNGGAVVDSDPSTLLLIPGTRRRKALFAGVALAVALVSFAVVWFAASGPSGGPAAADSTPGPSSGNAGSAPVTTVTPATPVPATPGSGVPSAASSLPGPAASTGTGAKVGSGSGVPKASPTATVTATAAAMATAKPTATTHGTARPASSGTNSRIGF